MARFLTYEYRLTPTKDQAQRISMELSKKDIAFNDLAMIVNDHIDLGADEDTLYTAMSMNLPGEAFDQALVQELEVLIRKRNKGLIDEIKRCNCNRRRRSYGFSPVSLSCSEVFIPNVGWVKMILHRPLPSNAHIFGAIVTEDEYGSVYKIALKLVMDSIAAAIPITGSPRIIGLDYKQDGLYMDSNGNLGGYPGFRKKAQAEIAALYEKSSRFSVGSSRWKKYRRRAAKLEAHIAHQRKDWQFKRAAQLASEYDAVSIETLDLNDMQSKNAALSPKLRDNNWPGFRRKLEDKLAEHGKPLIEVSRFFPSSQICSVCGHRFGKREPTIRIITCPNCGTILDRDINAARNIRDEGLRIMQAG